MAQSSFRALVLGAGIAVVAATMMPSPAFADEPARADAPTPPISPTTDTAGPGPTTPEGTKAPATPGDQVKPPADPERKESVEPKPALPPPPGRTKFDADPIADGAIIAVSLGFAGILD